MKKAVLRGMAILILLVVAKNVHADMGTKVQMETPFANNTDQPQNESMKCELVKMHSFSRNDRADTFKLIYNCNNLEDSISFQIIDFTGNTLYELKFTGMSFYDYGRPWYLYVTDPKRGANFDVQKMSPHVADSLQIADIQYLKSKMNDFFGEDRFMVNPSGNLDKKHLNFSYFDGIASDLTAIGFRLHLFVEGFEMIAYSKKMKKVQTIASAD